VKKMASKVLGASTAYAINLYIISCFVTSKRTCIANLFTLIHNFKIQTSAAWSECDILSTTHRQSVLHPV
jgi:hypothetical protein